MTNFIQIAKQGGNHELSKQVLLNLSLILVTIKKTREQKSHKIDCADSCIFFHFLNSCWWNIWRDEKISIEFIWRTLKLTRFTEWRISSFSRKRKFLVIFPSKFCTDAGGETVNSAEDSMDWIVEVIQFSRNFGKTPDVKKEKYN